MEASSKQPPPYESKEILIANGLENIFPDGALECSICREPIESSASIIVCSDQQSLKPSQADYGSGGPGTKDAATQFPERDGGQVAGDSKANPTAAGMSHIKQSQHPAPGPNPILSSSSSLEPPETAVRIRFCGHIFGRGRLLNWFKVGNTCPECRHILYVRKLHIRLHEPTRSHRTAFADTVESLGHEETANTVRENLMSDWTRELMREVLLAPYENAGYDVDWSYEGTRDEEEEDDEIDEDEDEEEDDGDEDVIDEEESENKEDCEGSEMKEVDGKD